MALSTVTVRRDAATGRTLVWVGLRSDEDALPHEHEEMHQQLVNKLIQGGVLKAAELGKVVVEREEKEAEKAPPARGGPQEQRQAQGQGN